MILLLLLNAFAFEDVDGETEALVQQDEGAWKTTEPRRRFGKKTFKKIGRGISRASRSVARGVSRVARSVVKGVKKTAKNVAKTVRNAFKKRRTDGLFTPKKFGDTNKGINEMRFTLYNRNNMGGVKVTRTQAGKLVKKYRKGKPLKVVSHGFLDSGEICKPFIEAYLKKRKMDVNVICLDWKGLAKLSGQLTRSKFWNIYDKAAKHSQWAGHYLGHFLMDLWRRLQRPRGFFSGAHFMGHSLGSHVMGRAGRTIKKSARRTVGRITAIDPAGPGFKKKISSGKANGRIRKSDARFLVVIHTNGVQTFSSAWRGAFGFGKPIGHVDFFANGGVKQPGCSVFSGKANIAWLQVGQCAHNRAPALMVESIVNTRAFPAYKCRFSFWKKLWKSNSCNARDKWRFGRAKGRRVYAGEATPTNARGTYWFHTRGSKPFAKSLSGRRRMEE